MDKFEYKVRADEIKELIARGEYIQAAEIADAIDWRRVKSVMMLCTISDLYKINRRYEDARNMLLLAYERRPGGRTICYALCELCIKTEEFVQAVNYYKEFVQVAPRDPGRYILQYKLYEAQDVSLEERIGVLEELKKRDYREKWAYELAYLYHRVGLATKCVEECDELILWFGEGKYVIKAMELKMLHQPLDAIQKEKYDRRFEPSGSLQHSMRNIVEQGQDSIASEDAYDNGQFYIESEEKPEAGNEAGALQGDTVVYENIRRAVQEQEEAVDNKEIAAPSQPEELDIHVKTMDMGKYNTINLQAELAAGLREVLEDEHAKSAAITRSIVAPMLDTESLDFPELEDEDIDENDVDNGVEQIEGTEVFFGDTGKLGAFQTEEQPVFFEENALEHEIVREVLPELREVQKPGISGEPDGVESRLGLDEAGEMAAEKSFEADAAEELPSEPEEVIQDETAQIVMNQLRRERLGMEQQVLTAQPPKELAGVLSQESDGQISLIIPERETVEKQITGQMNIEDVLAEWERLKQESQERREEEVRQRVRQQTGNMFTEFEASVRDGLLEQLESGAIPDIDEDEPESPENVEESAEADAESSENAEELEEASDAELSENTEELEETADAELSEDAEEQGQNAGDSENIEEASETVDGNVLEEAGTDIGETEDFGEVEELEEIQEETEESPQEMEESQQETEEPSQEMIEAPQEEERSSQETEEPQQKAEASEETEEPRQPSEEREKVKARALTQEEKELFAPYIQSKAAKEQLVQAIDNISLAAYTGNIVITGDEGMDTTTLSKNMIREVQLTDSNFSGKVAKISGKTLNKKDVAETISKLKNGALIIQKASEMNQETAAALHRELQRESLGIIVVLEDSKKAANKFLEDNKELAACFTSRMNVEALSNDMLVAFGRQYAKGKEYSIDDLGVLALHTRIEEQQTIDHAVTVLEVKQMVDEAIHHANRKTLGHFLDVLMARRYDEEDMIILTEKDFV